VQLTALRKTYAGQTPALDNVTLVVRPGEIFGIMGRSGAGKSTLLRCVNLLERPDSGRVEVAGEDILALDPAALRAARRGIGMVFQHFNLLASRTVAANIAFPLAIAGVGRAEQRDRVAALLALVGLSGKADATPRQLSGGQKQRVGIARALANRPALLLCDEATSALDPETTAEILALIRGLRERLALTVLLITHEMAVVQNLCDRVAILDSGQVIEQGAVFDVFTRPQSDIARRFVAEVIGHDIPSGTIERLPAPGPDEARQVLRILFTGPASTRAVISEATRRFGLDINIISGRIDEIGGEPFGLMAVAAYGAPAQIEAGIAWMRGLGLDVAAAA
jgi:D-methionine transport system ATP-binding protein